MKPIQYRLMYELEDRHWWFLGKREFIRSFLGEKVTDGRILDLGAGTGGTSFFLRKWGEVTAVEASSYAEKYLKRRKVKYLKSKIENLALNSASFDLVCFLDVLYHKNVSSDIKVLQIAKRLLKPQGLLLITDSALPFIYSRHDLEMHGRERYYLSKIAWAVTKAGFSIERSSYIFFFTLPLFLSSRLINKFVSFNTIAIPHPLVNALLVGVCKLEAKLVKHLSLPIGSSLILLARKT